MPHRSLHRQPHPVPSGTVHHLSPWQRRGLYITLTLLTLTSLPWLVLHYTIGAGSGELPHPMEPWLMRAHGLAAFAGLFMFGVIAGVHVPRGWRMSARLRWAKQRALGLIVSVLCGGLALSAYAMFYLLPEDWHAPVGWAHAVIGLLLVVALPLHVRGLKR